MPKRSSKPTRDENEAAFAAVRHIIQTTEETPADRVLALERLCREVSCLKKGLLRKDGSVFALPEEG